MQIPHSVSKSHAPVSNPTSHPTLLCKSHTICTNIPRPLVGRQLNRSPASHVQNQTQPPPLHLQFLLTIHQPSRSPTNHLCFPHFAPNATDTATTRLAATARTAKTAPLTPHPSPFSPAPSPQSPSSLSRLLTPSPFPSHFSLLSQATLRSAPTFSLIVSMPAQERRWLD